MQSEPLVLELEFVRKSSSSSPYEFQFTPQDYILRRGLGRYDEAAFPWTTELLRMLEQVRLPGRDPAAVQKLGDTLRQFLATTGWATSEAQILSAVELQRPVVLTLRSAAAELYALPWELMTLQQGGQHLGALPSVLLRYEWPSTSAAPEEPRREPGGRILFAWSAAAGAVPAAEHQQALQQACKKAQHSFDLEHDVIPNVSYGRLGRALDQAKQSGSPIAVLHLLCHGASIGSGFGLAFCDDQAPGNGESAIIDAAHLRQLLAPHAGTIRLVVLSACDSGNSGAFGNHLGSLAQELHRARIAQVVASRYPLSANGSIHLTHAFYNHLLGRSGSVAQAFLSARQELAQDASQLDWAAVQLYSAADPQEARPILFCPYPGMQPYASQHERFFCGRERESQELADRFLALKTSQSPRLLAVLGPSGSGKSSLLFAGALPRILSQCQAGTKHTVLRPGAHPLKLLERACSEFSAGEEQILIIDQFEELLTQGADENEQRNFCLLLFNLATADSKQVSVLLGLRSDFFYRAAELALGVQGRKLGSILSNPLHGYWLTLPKASELRDAIITSAARVGLRLQAGLLERIVEELDAQPGALPLLQLTMQKLWQRRDGSWLTQDSFDRLGEVAGVVLQHAEQVLDSLAPEEASLLQQLFLRLGTGFSTGSQPVRRRVASEKLRPSLAAQERRWDSVLARLLSERLVIASGHANEEGSRGAVEVAHDALIGKWPRFLLWVDKARPMLALRENLDRWVLERRTHQTLLTGSQLGYAVQMAAQFPDAVDDEARELLAQSERSRAAEEELKLRGLDTLRLLAAKSVFAADSTRIATALLNTRSDEVTTIPGWLETSIDILHNQVLCSAEIEHGWGLCDAGWSPDGQTVILAGLDGTVQLWEPGANTLQRLGTDHKSSVRRASYSPDGEKVLTACADGTLRVWSVSSGALLLQMIGHEDAIEAASFSRDGRLVATASDDQTVRLFDAQTGKQLGLLIGPKSEVMGVGFAPDGHRIYAAYYNGAVSVFAKADKGKWSHTVLVQEGPPLTSLALSADGTQLATGSTDAGVRVYDLANLDAPLVLWGHTDAISKVAFSPDGDFMLSCSPDRSAWLWSLRAERPPCLLSGHRMAVNSASFSRGGKQIVTACGDGRARIWDATRGGLDNPRRLKPRVPLPEGIIYRTCSLELSSSPVTSANGRYSAVVTSETTVQVTPPDDQGLPFSVSTEPDSISGLRFTPDENQLVVIAAHRILLCDLKERACRWLLGHTWKITCFAISPNSKWLITGAEDWTARVWPLSVALEPRVLSGHEETPVLVLFDKESRRALTVEHNGATRIWPELGPPIVLLSKDRPDHTVAIAPDWKTLLTQTGTDEDPQIYLWDLDLDPKAVQQRLSAATKLELSAEEYQALYLKKPPREPAR